MVFFVVCELRNGKRAAASFWISQPFFFRLFGFLRIYSRAVHFFSAGSLPRRRSFFYYLQTCIV